MCRRLHNGELLNNDELREIAENFIISRHAEQRIRERYADINLKKAILYPVIAYYNTDGSINIAINGFEYIVISADTYKVITFKEKSFNAIDIFAKRELAVRGIKRKLQYLC